MNIVDSMASKGSASPEKGGFAASGPSSPAAMTFDRAKRPGVEIRLKTRFPQEGSRSLPA